MTRSVLYRRCTFALAMAALAMSVLVGIPPNAAHAAATWKPQTSDATRGLTGRGGLFSLTFVDKFHGWAAGQDGGILATSDGGAHWTAHDEAWSYYHDGLFFADATHGWAAHGHIYATSDGGATWVAQTSGAADEFYAITFVDATRGWAVGGKGTYDIAATTDGGATWTAQMGIDITGDYASSTIGNTGLNAVAFTDADHGWAVGFRGAIFATTDGGATWTAQSSGTSAYLQSVAFPDSTHGWAVGGDGQSAAILATTDGGATWTAQTQGPDSLHSVAFTDADHGWVVGGTYDSGNHSTGSVILATSDGGATWIAQESGTKDGLNSVSFVNDTHGWAVGENGTVLVYNTAPIPASSALPRIGGFIAAAVVMLGIVLGLVLVLRSRRRKVSNGVGASDGLPSDPYAQARVGGGPGALAGATADSEMVRYCTGCGSPLRSDSAFCASCGAKTAR